MLTNMEAGKGMEVLLTKIQIKYMLRHSMVGTKSGQIV